MKFNLVKANPFNNMKIKDRVIIGVTSIFLVGSITVGIVFGITGCNKKQPNPSNTSTSVVTSDPNQDSTHVPTNSNASENSTETPGNSNNPDTSTSNPTSSNKPSNTPSSKPSTSTPSSKPSSSTPSNPPTSSSTPSQPPVDGYFDPRNATQVNAIVDELSSQFTAAGKTGNADKTLLLELVKFANNVKIPENETHEYSSLQDNITAGTSLNSTDVAKVILEKTGLGTKKTVSIEKIFANKKDRAIVEYFSKEKEKIVDAALQGKTSAELKVIIEAAYNFINQVAYDGVKVQTSMGKLGMSDVGNVAQYTVLLYSERITAYIQLIEEKYSIDLQSSQTEGKCYSKQDILMDKIINNNASLALKSVKTNSVSIATLKCDNQKNKVFILI
jgi:hypothetical protein